MVKTEADYAGFGEDAEVVGVMDVDDKYKVQGFTIRRLFCTNCKKGIHSEPNKMRCKEKGCECKCTTHYIGRDGLLRPYGVADNSIVTEKKFSKESDKEFDNIMSKAKVVFKKK